MSKTISELTTGTDFAAGDLMEIERPGSPAVSRKLDIGTPIAGRRKRLTADTTYYVRTDGSDANTGLANTAGGAWLDINYGIRWLRDNIDAAGFKVVLQVGDATRTYTINLFPIVGVDPGGYATSQLVLRGNTTTLGNVLQSVTGGNAIQGVNCNTGWRVEGFEFRTITSGACVLADFGTNIYLGKNKFGACAGIHIQALYGSKVEIVDDYTVSDAAVTHWYAQQGGQILQVSGKTTTITGTPAFSSSWVAAYQSAVITSSGVIFSGSATGVRWLADASATFNTNAVALNSHYPGNANGSVQTLALSAAGSGYVGIQLESTNPDAVAGPGILYYRNSASPAAADVLGQNVFSGLNASAGYLNYASMYAAIVSAVAAAENGEVIWVTKVAGADALSLRIGAGVQVGAGPGGYPGTGNLATEGWHASAAPVTKTGTSSTVGASDSSVIFNPSNTHTVTLPVATGTNTGRWLHLKTIAAFAINSASSNVVPIGSASAGTAILAATAGKWARLQSDGTNWVVMETG